MIDPQTYLDQISRIDFSDSTKPSLQQLQERLKDVFNRFPLTGLTLWTLNNGQTMQCQLLESSIDNDFRQILGSANPIVDLNNFQGFYSLLSDCKQPLLFSQLNPGIQQEINQVRPEALQNTEMLFHPVHSARGLEGVITCRPESPFEHWQEHDFCRFLNHLLTLCNAYLSYCHQQLLNQLQSQNDLLSEVEELAHVGSWEYQLDNQNVYWSDETYRIYGLKPGTDVSPEEGISYYGPEDQEVIRNAFQQALEQGTSYQHQLRFTDAQGNHKWIRTTGKARRKNGVITHVFGGFEDISREQQLIEHEKSSTAYIQDILDNLNDAVIAVDSNSRIVTANRTVKNIFGFEAEELIGQNISALMPKPYCHMHDKYMRSYLENGNAKIIGVGRELPAVRKNGEEFPMELSLTETEQNGQRLFIGIIRDISDRKEAEDKLFRLAFFDNLTELPNRTSFERDVMELVSKAELTGADIYASFLDIDRFSQINLTYGKRYGDYALNMISKRIASCLPKEFKLYRNNADSFFLLHKYPVNGNRQALLKHTSELCQKILQQISDELVINNHSHNLTLSIGSTLTPSQGLKGSRLINMLEYAANRAKDKGGNCHITVDKHTHAEIEHKAFISNSLIQGLNDGEFSLVLQPQYDRNMTLVASEALIRWHSQQLGFVSPADFIPIAEDTGKIILIGDWVLNEVCRILHQQAQQGVHTTIAVNISAKQIIQPDFCDKLLVITNRWLVTAEQLILEITETTLVSDIELVKQRMNYLSKLGFRFSIDDFGTGYSSLSYLRQLPLHELKIDRFFVDEIDLQGSEVPIINSIIHMAKALGVSVVAEGVENQAQQNYLIDRGCDTLQGFHLNKPMPVDAWRALFE
ncbi:MAG: hypothetical protein AseanaTS_11030 [Candidatus Pelagadaptatus aseana]|uniref:putative bifunctional diguanylate cyclase/phosphodiesterase n=1 Tax=Candidatus Pelagadaptatus aseana TaxID=3120508 RepID=UPI0039B30500